MIRSAMLLLLLAGCNPLVRQDELDAAKQDARITANAVAELEARVAELEADLTATQKHVEFVDKVNTAVSDQVANNARIANENAARDMTERGLCGTELVKLDSGLYQNRRIPCTVDDLRK